MNEVFEKLKKISDSYKKTATDIAENYDLDGRKDYLYSDEVKGQREAERNIRFNAEIDKAAEKALSEAMAEIDKLRGAVREYVVSSDDAAALAALQALVSSGVELSDSELAAFSQKGGFATWKLLEKSSGGKVRAPRLERLEEDLGELTSFFKNVVFFRGGLGGINVARPWGQSGTFGDVVMRGQLDKFPEKLSQMQERWEKIEM